MTCRCLMLCSILLGSACLSEKEELVGAEKGFSEIEIFKRGVSVILNRYGIAKGVSSAKHAISFKSMPEYSIKENIRLFSNPDVGLVGADKKLLSMIESNDQHGEIIKLLDEWGAKLSKPDSSPVYIEVSPLASVHGRGAALMEVSQKGFQTQLFLMRFIQGDTIQIEEPIRIAP
jgi:hypothetical protein